MGRKKYVDPITADRRLLAVEEAMRRAHIGTPYDPVARLLQIFANHLLTARNVPPWMKSLRRSTDREGRAGIDAVLMTDGLPLYLRVGLTNPYHPPGQPFRLVHSGRHTPLLVIGEVAAGPDTSDTEIARCLQSELCHVHRLVARLGASYRPVNFDGLEAEHDEP